MSQVLEGINSHVSYNRDNPNFNIKKIQTSDELYLKQPDLKELDIYSLKLIKSPFTSKSSKSNINKFNNLKIKLSPSNERNITLKIKPQILEKPKSTIKEKHSDENKSISLKFLEYFKLHWKRFWKKKLNNKERLFLLSEKRLIKESDIVHILEKIHQFEKLKMIILNPR